jgi:hypothetical protein
MLYHQGVQNPLLLHQMQQSSPGQATTAGSSSGGGGLNPGAQQPSHVQPHQQHLQGYVGSNWQAPGYPTPQQFQSLQQYVVPNSNQQAQQQLGFAPGGNNPGNYSQAPGHSITGTHPAPSYPPHSTNQATPPGTSQTTGKKSRKKRK